MRRSVEVGERAQSMVAELPAGGKLRRAIEMAREKGASCVFSVRPSEELIWLCFQVKEGFQRLTWYEIREADALAGTLCVWCGEQCWSLPGLLVGWVYHSAPQ